MAAAYASLVSLMHIIDQLQQHPRPPISLDKSQVESLTEKVTFLQDFLEGYSHGRDTKEADGLVSRIADAAYAAEDVIESHIVDQIHSESTSRGETNSSTDFYECLQKVIDCMDFITKEVMEIEEKIGIRDHIHRNRMLEDSRRSSSTRQNIMVGFDDELNEVLNKLIGQPANSQIIPIVGMGGIGKTTLARNVYLNRLIQHHFHICAWTTISQEYSTREILREVLGQVNKGGSGDSSENELGERLHKDLSGRRYLIVMDDMWSIEAWEKIKFFFPDNNNGSRIVITTRLSNLASQLNKLYWLHMKFLDVDKSWNLFSKIVFGGEGCPLELEEIGKKIAKGCSGLPLSIVVIGGLLAKSKHERGYWAHIAQNINSIMNIEDSCFNILSMSYNELPVYLKPCFLYVGVFPEDRKIRVSMLMELWIAEGFVKPVSGKSLEVVAQEYLEGLINRNLILVQELGSTGNIKYCNIHDLLRDFCLREAQNERLYNVMKQQSLNISQGINTPRRIVIPKWLSPEKKFSDALQSMPLARSLYYYSWRSPPVLNFRLLRIWKKCDKGFFLRYSNSLEDVSHLVNLRYFAVTAEGVSTLSSSLYLFWNLHTLIVDHWDIILAPSEIWKMPQLRHVKFRNLDLPDPPTGDGNDIVLENLRTLSDIRNFKFGEEIIKRIPNIKKLHVNYFIFEGPSHYFFSNLDRLHKLESLSGIFLPISPGALRNLTFPHSLKSLTIQYFDSKDVLEKIGSLPLLEKLKLKGVFFQEHEWETVEGQFCSLKFLRIEECYHFRHWKTESTHFPRLERLVLRNLEDLEEIPSDIGEISTLQSIHLQYCNDSAVVSAKRIQEEQEELGNESLQVRVRLWGKNHPLNMLASQNFKVECL